MQFGIRGVSGTCAVHNNLPAEGTALGKSTCSVVARRRVPSAAFLWVESSHANNTYRDSARRVPARWMLAANELLLQAASFPESSQFFALICRFQDERWCRVTCLPSAR